MLYDPKWQMNPIGKTLLAAASYIDEHGWCQGRAQDMAGRVCIVGALCSTYPDDAAMRDATNAFLMHMLDDDFPAWNDAPGRTQAEVVAKLRELAALSSAQGTKP